MRDGQGNAVRGRKLEVGKDNKLLLHSNPNSTDLTEVQHRTKRFTRNRAYMNVRYYEP